MVLVKAHKHFWCKGAYFVNGQLHVYVHVFSAKKTADVSCSCEEERKFQTRYENGCDLPDEKYFQWLQKHHPSFALTFNGMGVVVVLCRTFYISTLKGMKVEVTAQPLPEDEDTLIDSGKKKLMYMSLAVTSNIA